MQKLKKWEIALICAVAVTLLTGGGTPCRAWWGTVYPDAAPTLGGAQAVADTAAEEGVILRFRTLEWLEAWMRTLNSRK